MSIALSYRGLAGAGVVALALWPLVLSSPYDLRVFGLAGIYAILVLGYQFIFGHAGALALTQGMFFGLAAYITAVLGVRLDWSAAATLPLSILGPMLIAALVAVPVLRLETHYFALATLGLAQIALLIAVKWEAVTGGSNGLAGVPPLALFGAEVPSGLPMVAVIWGAVVLCAAAAWRAMRGLQGLAFRAIREDPLMASAIGIDASLMRFAAFLASAAYAGLAGALHAHMLRVVSPEVLEFHVMVACLSMAVVGGRTRVAGAIVGAVLLVHLPEWLRGFENYYLIVYGAVLLAMIVAAPEGIAGLLARLSRKTERDPPEHHPKAMTEPSAWSGGRLEVKQVSKRFGGIQALRDVSLTVAPGEIVGLIGPNGSGKTTLLNIISALYPADAGTVSLAGETIGGARSFEAARRGIARSFQRVSLVGDLSALDNVTVAWAGSSRSTSGVLGVFSDRPLTLARSRAMALLDRLGIAGHAFESAGTLPQGVRRRVEIARALALRPRVLLLDEPAAGLSPAEMTDLSVRLRALAEEGLGILLVEHNMPFLLPLADRVLCLDRGAVIAEGRPDEVRNHPAVRAAYLGDDGR